MRIHVLPASDVYARQHFDDSVSFKVTSNTIKTFITDDEILRLLTEDSYAIWGIKKGKTNVNHKKWLRMTRGDICLFYRDRHFFSAGKIICKFESNDFASYLWKGIPRNSDIDKSETWENMFIFDEIKKINIPLTSFNTFMGFAEKNLIRGYNNYDDEISERIINKFNLNNWETIDSDHCLIDDVNEINNDDSKTKTQKQILTEARIGQGRYKKELVSLWKCCSFSGYSNTSFLIGSHIKPWSKCENDFEKLDKFNGLLLSPNIDKLFDSGLISFQDNGQIILSSTLTQKDLQYFNISNNSKIEFFKENLKYIKFHREVVFKK